MGAFLQEMSFCNVIMLGYLTDHGLYQGKKRKMEPYIFNHSMSHFMENKNFVIYALIFPVKTIWDRQIRHLEWR